MGYTCHWCGWIFLALVLPESALAHGHPKWTIETQNYTLEISEPIGLIPTSAPIMDLITRDNDGFYWVMADRGCALFRRIRDEQAATIWFPASLKGVDPDSSYDGALSFLVLTTKDGPEYPVRQILGAPIRRGVDPSRIPVYVVTIGTPYEFIRCENKHGESYVVWLGFDRAYGAADVAGFYWTGGK